MNNYEIYYEYGNQSHITYWEAKTAKAAIREFKMYNPDVKNVEAKRYK